MATQTGECQIDAIEGNVIRGWFKSVYSKNVGTGTAGWAGMFLYDALQSLSGVSGSEDTIRAAVAKVTFDKPRKTKTNFVIEMANMDAVKGLETGYWESYYVG